MAVGSCNSFQMIKNPSNFLFFFTFKKNNANDGDHVGNDNADDDDGNGEEDVDDDIVECTLTIHQVAFRGGQVGSYFDKIVECISCGDRGVEEVEEDVTHRCIALVSE